jgi:hypothetical protein
MAALDYNTAEAELRDIETDFATGRLSAFGSGGSQEEVFREMKKVSELEVQVFIRTCAQIKALSEEESLVQRTLRDHAGIVPPAALQRLGSEANAAGMMRQDGAEAGATPPTVLQAQDNGSTVQSPNSNSTPAKEFPGGATSASPLRVRQLDERSLRSPETGPAASGTSFATSTADGDVWALHGSSDKAFEDMAKLFKVKEAAVKASADNLRQMAKHINSANEALHRAHAASGY